MPEAYIALTPVHWFYLVGVLVILFTMILRKDTPLVCIASFLESALLENAVWPGEYRPSSVPLFMPSVNLGR